MDSDRAHTPPNLITLPTELLLEIASHLAVDSDSDPSGFASSLALRWTCRTLYRTISLPKSPILVVLQAGTSPHMMRKLAPPRRTYDRTVKTLLAMERWPEYWSARVEDDPSTPSSVLSRARTSPPPDAVEAAVRQGPFAPKLPGQSRHACSSCLRLRRTQDFHVAQVTGKKAKLGRADGDSATLKDASAGAAAERERDVIRNGRLGQRVCIPCCVKSGRYKGNDFIKFFRHTDDAVVTLEGRDDAGDAAPCLDPNAGKQTSKKIIIEPAPPLEAGTGFRCQRCIKFCNVPAPASSPRTPAAKDQEGPMQNTSFLRRTCPACLAYRSPWERRETYVNL